MDRRYPIVPFDPLRFEGFFGNEVLHATLLPGGACNSNYLVTTSSRDRFVCRIYQRGDPRQESYIAGLAKDVVPVPKYLWVGAGAAVLTFLEGEEFSPSVALMREAGRTIARISSLPFDRSGQILADGSIITYEGWGSLYDGLSGLLDNETVREFLPEPLRDQTRLILENSKHILEQLGEDHVLVHGDFGSSNILVSNDKITGVLDWEFSHSGTRFMDIGNILRHYSPQWEAVLAEGLRDEGVHLPDDWRFRAHLIDLASHLEFLTSKRSDTFKQQCVSRIDSFVTMYG